MPTSPLRQEASSNSACVAWHARTQALTPTALTWQSTRQLPESWAWSRRRPPSGAASSPCHRWCCSCTTGSQSCCRWGLWLPGRGWLQGYGWQQEVHVAPPQESMPTGQRRPAQHTTVSCAANSAACCCRRLQVAFEWFVAIVFYTYTAWLPTFFKSQGITAVTTQVGAPGGGGGERSRACRRLARQQLKRKQRNPSVVP
jgi:hypothetical protein